MDVLEITGEPVTLTLDGKEYPLAFPMAVIALYKQETAKLNCRRAREAELAGRPKLTIPELRDFKRKYRKIIDDLSSDGEFLSEMDDAVALRIRIDEEIGNGDSLLQMVNWWKIREDDPERIVLALWCAMHTRQEDGAWKAPLTVGQLNDLIDFSNIGSLLEAVTRSLMRHMPKRKDVLPNAEALAAARVM